MFGQETKIRIILFQSLKRNKVIDSLPQTQFSNPYIFAT